MFRIKICGVTSIEDAQSVAVAGADAVGLNFHPPSPRYVDQDTAERIVGVLPAGITKVGVFVNASASQINDVFDRLSLDLIQLHGDETPNLVRHLDGRSFVRAFRMKAARMDELRTFLQRCTDLGRPPQAAIVDAFEPGQYGGTGAVVDWHELAKQRPLPAECPLVLAGGLTPGNIARAIHTVRPAAVDVASGVESSPGIKDRRLMSEFVQRAAAAFDRLDGES